MSTLTPEPLTREAFEPYGSVVDTAGGVAYPINGGMAERHPALAEIDVAGAPPVISIIVARDVAEAPEVTLLERHPFGSQAFVPLSPNPWTIVVAHLPDVRALRAFSVAPGQGVQIGRGVWHAPLLAREAGDAFLVVDRAEPEQNVEIVTLDTPVPIAGI